MSYETINTHHAIDLFWHLMQPDSQIRVLRLLGDAKMGKSHLLIKVFPTLAQQKLQARCVLLDLRNSIYTIPDILNVACSQLGAGSCDGYYTAHQEISNRSRIEINKLQAAFARIDISAKDTIEDIRYKDRELTTQFVNDVRKLSDKPLLLLFDSVNNATEDLQTWLMETLLIPLSSLVHVRVVVAGRSLPEPHVSYMALCQTYQLLPVSDMKEYIDYCHDLHATLVEQSIRDFAEAFDYKPGMFVEFVHPHFVP